MVSTSQIAPDMPVVCSKGGQFAVVDHMQEGMIKLKKDKNGDHHFIPVDWVKSAEHGKLTVDRPGEQAMREWSTTPHKQKQKH